MFRTRVYTYSWVYDIIPSDVNECGYYRLHSVQCRVLSKHRSRSSWI